MHDPVLDRMRRQVRRGEDHFTVNEVMAETVDAVQDEVLRMGRSITLGVAT